MYQEIIGAYPRIGRFHMAYMMREQECKSCKSLQRNIFLDAEDKTAFFCSEKCIFDWIIQDWKKQNGVNEASSWDDIRENLFTPSR